MISHRMLRNLGAVFFLVCLYVGKAPRTEASCNANAAGIGNSTNNCRDDCYDSCAENCLANCGEQMCSASMVDSCVLDPQDHVYDGTCQCVCDNDCQLLPD